MKFIGDAAWPFSAPRRRTRTTRNVPFGRGASDPRGACSARTSGTQNSIFTSASASTPARHSSLWARAPPRARLCLGRHRQYRGSAPDGRADRRRGRRRGTYCATRDAHRVRTGTRGPRQGQVAPIPCWQASRARSSVGETRRRRDAAPLIDRLREREALRDAFERAHRDRSPQCLTLVGVPGIGKSRLVRELFHDLDRRPELIRWREGRSPPYGSGVTFWALGEIVKAEAGMLESHESGAAASKLATAVAGVIEDTDEARVGRASSGCPCRAGGRGDPFRRSKGRGFRGVAAVHRAARGRRPTVLVLEDLHWADDAFLDFVEYLLAWAADVELLLVCTARPESSSDAQAGGGLRYVTSSLVGTAHRAGDAGAPRRTHSGRRCCRRKRGRLCSGAATGNPLYARGVRSHARGPRILGQREGEWIVERTDDLPVPDSMLGIIAARLDAVPSEDRAVIQDASVVGKVFWPFAVAHVAERGRWAVEEALRRLEQKAAHPPQT